MPSETGCKRLSAGPTTPLCAMTACRTATCTPPRPSLLPASSTATWRCTASARRRRRSCDTNSRWAAAWPACRSGHKQAPPAGRPGASPSPPLPGLLCPALLQAHATSCRAARFSAAGDLVYTASTDQSILAVDCASGKAQARKKDAHDTAINRLACTGPTGLASGALDCTRGHVCSSAAGATSRWHGVLLLAFCLRRGMPWSHAQPAAGLMLR